MKERITNPELKRLIKKELRKTSFEEIDDDEINLLEGIELRQHFPNGQPTQLEIPDIFNFPNLSNLNLVGYEINQSNMETIIKSEKLENIQFDSCGFSDVNFSSLERLPRDIFFFRCSNLPENYWKNGVINIEQMDIDFNQIPFEEVTKIRMRNCRIKNVYDIEKYQNIEGIILDASTLIDSENNEIKDIKTNEKTHYSHEPLERHPVMNDIIERG